MFCKKCGSKLEDGDLFCQNCGTRVEADFAKYPECDKSNLNVRNYPNVGEYRFSLLARSLSRGFGIRKFILILCMMFSSVLCFALEPKVENLLKEDRFELATNAFVKRTSWFSDKEKIAELKEFIYELRKKINSIKVPDSFNFDGIDGEVENLLEYARKAAASENKDESVVKWYDWLAALGGYGPYTVSYIAARGMNEAFNATDRNVYNSIAGETLVKYDIPKLQERDLEVYDALKISLLTLDSFIKECLENCEVEYQESYANFLDHPVREMKKILSTKRCNFVSYSFLAPRFRLSMLFAGLYNDQVRIWGVGDRDKALIESAFDVIGNHGDLIMQAAPDCRKYFTRKVIPALKMKLSEKEYNNYIALTGYNADGSTGPELWLDWKK